MVDREARRKYAELVRQFISGRMTNDGYETQFDAIKCDKDDPVVSEVYYQLWFLYDDIKTHRMTGTHCLDREGHRAIARMVLFLQSENEYRWPQTAWVGAARLFLLIIGAIFTLALLSLFPDFFLLIVSLSVIFGGCLILHCTIWAHKENRRLANCGDLEAWPFLNTFELNEAARHPRLLNGKGNKH